MSENSIFIDTSAFYALMDRSDRYHAKAADLWSLCLEEEMLLETSNYVVIESMALLQGRLGFEAASLWYRDMLDVVLVRWLDEGLHNPALDLWLGLGRRKLSFVDCTSFIYMRHFKLNKVFGFDPHFAEQGFELMPA